MNCRDMKQLISPYLDGELEARDHLAVKLHLDGCSMCSKDYREQLQISGMLKSMGRDIIPAPAGFSHLVMEAVKTETRPERPAMVWKSAPLAWKKYLAGAAAAAFLIFASAQWIIPTVQIAYHHPAVQDRVNPDANITNHVPDASGDSTANQTTPGSGTTIPSDSQANQPLVVADNVNPGTSPSPSTNPVLLSEENRNILTTMLMIQAAQDQGSALEKAESIAAENGAATDRMGQQIKGDVSYTLLKITVDRARGEVLMNRLSTLGTRIDFKQDQQDISQAYTQALEQFLSLSKKRGETQDSSEIKALDQQLASLQAQLNNWKLKAGVQTIVLWIQE